MFYLYTFIALFISLVILWIGYILGYHESSIRYLDIIDRLTDEIEIDITGDSDYGDQDQENH